MKLERNKILFIGVIALVIIFIVCYAVFVMGGAENEQTELTQPVVPELKEEQKEYSSKLEAIDDLKEVRESNAPSIYDESLLDSTGLYDPLFQEKERQRIVDSIYAEGRINYESGDFRRNPGTSYPNAINKSGKNQIEETAIDFSTAHQEFFQHVPKSISSPFPAATSSALISVIC